MFSFTKQQAQPLWGVCVRTHVVMANRVCLCCADAGSDTSPGALRLLTWANEFDNFPDIPEEGEVKRCRDDPWKKDVIFPPSTHVLDGVAFRHILGAPFLEGECTSNPAATAYAAATIVRALAVEAGDVYWTADILLTALLAHIPQEPQPALIAAAAAAAAPPPPPQRGPVLESILRHINTCVTTVKNRYCLSIWSEDVPPITPLLIEGRHAVVLLVSDVRSSRTAYVFPKPLTVSQPALFVAVSLKTVLKLCGPVCAPTETPNAPGSVIVADVFWKGMYADTGLVPLAPPLLPVPAVPAPQPRRLDPTANIKAKEYSRMLLKTLRTVSADVFASVCTTAHPCYAIFEAVWRLKHYKRYRDGHTPFPLPPAVSADDARFAGTLFPEIMGAAMGATAYLYQNGSSFPKLCTVLQAVLISQGMRHVMIDSEDAVSGLFLLIASLSLSTHATPRYWHAAVSDRGVILFSIYQNCIAVFNTRSMVHTTYTLPLSKIIHVAAWRVLERYAVTHMFLSFGEELSVSVVPVGVLPPGAVKCPSTEGRAGGGKCIPGTRLSIASASGYQATFYIPHSPELEKGKGEKDHIFSSSFLERLQHTLGTPRWYGMTYSEFLYNACEAKGEPLDVTNAPAVHSLIAFTSQLRATELFGFFDGVGETSYVVQEEQQAILEEYAAMAGQDLVDLCSATGTRGWLPRVLIGTSPGTANASLIDNAGPDIAKTVRCPIRHRHGRVNYKGFIEVQFSDRTGWGIKTVILNNINEGLVTVMWNAFNASRATATKDYTVMVILHLNALLAKLKDSADWDVVENYGIILYDTSFDVLWVMYSPLYSCTVVEDTQSACLVSGVLFGGDSIRAWLNLHTCFLHSGPRTRKGLLDNGTIKTCFGLTTLFPFVGVTRTVCTRFDPIVPRSVDLKRGWKIVHLLHEAQQMLFMELLSAGVAETRSANFIGAYFIQEGTTHLLSVRSIPNVTAPEITLFAAGIPTTTFSLVSLPTANTAPIDVSRNWTMECAAAVLFNPHVMGVLRPHNANRYIPIPVVVVTRFNRTFVALSVNAEHFDLVQYVRQRTLYATEILHPTPREVAGIVSRAARAAAAAGTWNIPPELLSETYVETHVQISKFLSIVTNAVIGGAAVPPNVANISDLKINYIEAAHFGQFYQLYPRGTVSVDLADLFQLHAIAPTAMPVASRFTVASGVHVSQCTENTRLVTHTARRNLGKIRGWQEQLSGYLRVPPSPDYTLEEQQFFHECALLLGTFLGCIVTLFKEQAKTQSPPSGPLGVGVGLGMAMGVSELRVTTNPSGGGGGGTLLEGGGLYAPSAPVEERLLSAVLSTLPGAEVERGVLDTALRSLCTLCGLRLYYSYALRVTSKVLQRGYYLPQDLWYFLSQPQLAEEVHTMKRVCEEQWGNLVLCYARWYKNVNCGVSPSARTWILQQPVIAPTAWSLRDAYMTSALKRTENIHQAGQQLAEIWGIGESPEQRQLIYDTGRGMVQEICEYLRVAVGLLGGRSGEEGNTDFIKDVLTAFVDHTQTLDKLKTFKEAYRTWLRVYLPRRETFLLPSDPGSGVTLPASARRPPADLPASTALAWWYCELAEITFVGLTYLLWGFVGRETHIAAKVKPDGSTPISMQKTGSSVGGESNTLVPYHHGHEDEDDEFAIADADFRAAIDAFDVMSLSSK